jgi:hypothetical protein
MRMRISALALSTNLAAATPIFAAGPGGQTDHGPHSPLASER